MTTDSSGCTDIGSSGLAPLCHSETLDTFCDDGAGLISFSRSIPPLAKSTGQQLPDVLTATLPGHGQPGTDCGEPVAHFCNACGHSFWVKRSCVLRECPNCFEKWAWREASRSSWRAWTGTQDRFWRFGVRARLVHCVLSVRYEEQQLSELRDQARHVLKKHGIVGGLLVFHPFRQDDDGQFANDGTVHFHVIGLAPGDITPGGESESVVFKVVPDAKHDDYRGFRRHRELRQCIQYLLSHCGVVQGRHTVTWFGELSYNKLSQQSLEDAHPEAVEAMERVRSVRCPECGSYDTERCDGTDRTLWSERMLVQVHPYPTEPPPSRSPQGIPSQAGLLNRAAATAA